MPSESTDVTAVTFDPTIAAAWQTARAGDRARVHLPEKDRAQISFARYLRTTASRPLTDDDFLTLVIPEILELRGLWEILRHPTLHRLKGSLLREPGVQVMDIPVLRDAIDPALDQAHEPGSATTLSFWSAASNNATLQAIEYAETLRPTDIRAVSFGLDAERSEALGNAWLESGISHPLEIEASPFRDIGESLFVTSGRSDPTESTAWSPS